MQLSGIRGTVAAVGTSIVSTLALLSAGVAPAQAAGENWTVYSTHFSPNGHDLSLRLGRHDNAAGHVTGFGKYHIDDRGHRLGVSWGNFKQDIDLALSDSRTKCSKTGQTWTCTSNLPSGVNGTWGNMRVAYTHIDTATPDGRAKGIITAFYLNDCGCLSANGDEGAKEGIESDSAGRIR
ncbi:hypothetical protein ACIP88_34960 [Streptomyces uncialis]|uniref:hypothetical protein n=1 Tax=Streptomyces uncialis TaxID=1048205 RepID=UPI003809A74F